MADEYGTRSLVDQRPELVVYIPEAEELPQAPETAKPRQAPPTVVKDRSVPWIERRGAPWLIVAAAVAVIALLLLLQRPTIEVGAVQEGGGARTAIDPDALSWAALSLPVPESLRTHTANVAGRVDVLAVADLGAGQSFIGSVTTVDGAKVRQIFGDHAFSISSSTGATVVAFMPYQAGDALTVDEGQDVTFVGTLMPVPKDFAAMVGREAASISMRTAVYVRVVPETLRIVTTVSETS